MKKIFGNFQETFPKDNHEFLIIGFSPSSLPLKRRWKNNDLSANFIAEYLKTFFPLEDSKNEKIESYARKITESVNYIANELLENALKFNYENSPSSINFGLHLVEEQQLKVILTVSNNISLEMSEHFQAFIQELISCDPDEFYLRQLERSIENDKAPGVGLISMINDYFAQLGWKFESIPNQDHLIKVTTMVKLEYDSCGLFQEPLTI